MTHPEVRSIIYEGQLLVLSGEVRPPKKGDFFITSYGMPCQAACDFRDNVFNQMQILIPEPETPAGE